MGVREPPSAENFQETSLHMLEWLKRSRSKLLCEKIYEEACTMVKMGLQIIAVKAERYS